MSDLPSEPAAEPGGLRHLFRHRIFALIWAGAFVSNIGNWMENAAQNWAVVHGAPRGQAAFLSEILNFADFAPALLLVLFAGVITDRVNVKRYLLILQAMACLLGAGLAVPAWMGLASPWVVIAFTFAEGIVWALNGPPWLSVVPHLVPRSELPRAIALNSAQFNLARLLGPFLAGLAIVRWGIPAAFTVNAASFVPVIYALTRLPAEPRRRAAARRPVLRDLTTGLKIVAGHRGLRRLSVMLVCFMFLGAPLQGLLAVYAQQVLGGDSRTYGLLLGAIGLGALIGALTIGRVPAYYPRHHLIPLAMCLASTCVIAFTFAAAVPVAFAILTISGFFWMLSLNSSNAANQLLATDENRGRVMSVMLLCNQGAAPLGHLFAAGMTHLLSPEWVIRSMGLTSLGLMLFFLMKREPAIDAMDPRPVPPGFWAGVWEALTAQSHRPVPQAVRSRMAQEPPQPPDITPHAT